jgi:predicted dehydrogenase
MAVRTIHVGVGGRGVWPLRVMPGRDDFEPVALVDVRADKLAAARELTGLDESACFSALEEALDAVEADAVVVITPPDFHAKHCHMAVQAEKHVLVEKPFTKDLGSAQALVTQAAAANLQIAVCQNARYAAHFQTMRRLMESGVCGTPRYGMMTTYGWRPGVHHSGTDRHSYLWERGIHDLDTVRFLVDSQPRRIWAHSFNPPWSPYAGGGAFNGWIEFEGGVSFGMQCTFAARSKGSSLHLECDEGALEFGGGKLLLRRPGADAGEEIPLDDVAPPEKVLLDGFQAAINDGPEPAFSGSHNLTTMGLVEGMGAASDQGAVLDFAEYMSLRTF